MTTRILVIPEMVMTPMKVFVNGVDQSHIGTKAKHLNVDATAPVEIEIVPDYDYIGINPNNTGSVTIAKVVYPLEINSEGSRAFITVPGGSINSITLSFPETIINPVEVTFYGMNSTLTIESGRSSGNITQTGVLRDGDTVEVTGGSFTKFTTRADNGYRFTSYGILRHGDNITDITTPFSSDNTKGEINLNRIRYNTVVIMGATLIPEEVPTEVLGFNNIYLVDKQKLMDISKDIFNKRRSHYIRPGGVPGDFDPIIAVDPHAYIINTLQLPFAIEDSYIGPERSIEMGFTTIVPTAPTINKDKITVDLGTIEVPNKHKNIYDYSATDIVIHLPYLNPILLDTNYVVGQTVSIEYVVDVYTGEATVNLRSSLIEGRVFHSTVTYIGNVVPFITIKDTTTIGSPKDSRSVILNNTPTPFIEVVRNIPYQMDSQFHTSMRTTVDSIDGLKGRVYVHDIFLDLDATQLEVATIKSILASGITIK